MPESPSTNAIDELASRLGVEWPNIKNACEQAISKKDELNALFRDLVSADTSMVVFGSLARNEFTSGSDIDWTLLIDGLSDPGHHDTSQEIAKRLDEIGAKGPGREGTFGGLTISHELVHKIGGGDDSNRNMTQRVLLMLESAAIGKADAYNRTLRNVIDRYINEDFGLLKNLSPYNVPRFLQNDLARYWRTVAVDFAYKQRQRAGEGWALRTAKLRISRKLTYVSGLLMCYDCELSFPKHSHPEGIDSAEITNHLYELSHLTPLEVLAKVLNNHFPDDDVLRKLFCSYDSFLGLLGNTEKRGHLDSLGRERAESDDVYREVRQLGHEFQDSLTELFFRDGDNKLFDLTKIYGVF